jgi:hypothetical protein
MGDEAAEAISLSRELLTMGSSLMETVSLTECWAEEFCGSQSTKNPIRPKSKSGRIIAE